MKGNISMVIAVLAIIISIAAITSAVVIRPEVASSEDVASEFELADNSVISDHIVDGTITNDDISDSGLSKIADESITLSDLTPEVLAEMSGVVEILDNSILGSKLANASIFNRHIAESAEIDPSKISGTAWTAENDGFDSGLDADMLDGIHSNRFVRSDTEQTKYFTILPVAFNGLTHDAEYGSFQGWFYNTDPDHNTHSYYAPVYIPDGAKLTKLIIRYYRATENDVLRVSLSYNSNSSTSLISEYLPESVGYDIYEIEIPKHYVDNYLTGYFVGLSMDPFEDYMDVRVRYVCIEYVVKGSLQ